MVCENFKYTKVIEFFEKVASIPRMSGHEEKIADYLVSFASERGLEYYRDSVNNVLINIPATKGYEDKEPILLQGHTDMVCESEQGVEHDFQNDGLELYVDGEFLRARGTTLGADNGTAVSMMLALLDGAADAHPALQCLFTTREEIGLEGAYAFDYSRIFARKMINMDSDEEDTVVVGCAGGVRSDITFDIESTSPRYKNALKVTIGGLMGGHSGVDIHRGRASANKLMGKLLAILYNSVDFELASINGGTKDNAITRECEMVVLTNSAHQFKRTVNEFAMELKMVLSPEDMGLFVNCEEVDASCIDKVFTEEFTQKMTTFLNGVKCGVIEMSQNIDGLVEYSRNLGILKTEETRMLFGFSTRSAIAEQIEGSKEFLERASALYGGSARHYGEYPGWHYTGESALSDLYAETADRLFGTKVQKTVIHAGLECGIIKNAIPDMDIISCGPNVKDLHSPDERMEIASFERFFAILKDMIER